MKAVVVPLVVLLAVLAWPCAAQDEQCLAADTVVGGREEVSVAVLRRQGEKEFQEFLFLHPESAFEGVIVHATTTTGANVFWFPAYYHCFPPRRDWWLLGVLCYHKANSNVARCEMHAGYCYWHCDILQHPGRLLGGYVLAVGASRWRMHLPPRICTNVPHTYEVLFRHLSCSPPPSHPTTASPSHPTNGNLIEILM